MDNYETKYDRTDYRDKTVRSSRKKIDCICPKCKIPYTRKYPNWKGRIPAPLFCDKCKNLVTINPSNEIEHYTYLNVG